jgi:hypothetical protein
MQPAAPLSPAETELAKTGFLFQAVKQQGSFMKSRQAASCGSKVLIFTTSLFAATSE